MKNTHTPPISQNIVYSLYTPFYNFPIRFFSLADGNLNPTYAINQNYVELLGQWGMLVMSFYFGSRGIEKIVDIAGKHKNSK